MKRNQHPMFEPDAAIFNVDRYDINQSLMHINKLRNILVVITTFLILFSCSKDDGPIVDEILLTVSKDVALSMGDSILIMTEVLSEIDERLQNIPLDYYVNDTRLAGPIFYPDRPGVFRLSARYQEVTSTQKDVEVISLEDNITSLDLVYNGHTLLTTEEWSVSGAFSFDVQLNNLAFEVETNSIDLLVNGASVEERSALHFDEAGEYSIEAAFGSLKSSPIILEVREKLQLEEVVIPLVFHDYRQNLNQGQLQNLLDTLNVAFNLTFGKDEVATGVINPNAVNLKMTFEFASDAPPGFQLSGSGIHRIDDMGAVVDLNELIADNTWNPEKYVNIWLFTDPDVFDLDTYGPFEWVGRGFSSKPSVSEVEVPGLLTVDGSEQDLSAGLAVGALSVFAEHPDYIVSVMGNYFGLYNTSAESCLNHGDFVEDTKTLKFGGSPPTDYYFDCEDELMKATNFMAIGRRYRDFTYDQALRIRSVMKHGISRVGD